MADEYNDPFLSAGFIAAERFHIHFHHGDMEDYQIAADRPAVRDYVERMVTLIEEYEANAFAGRQIDRIPDPLMG